jgi:hypothetical protein
VGSIVVTRQAGITQDTAAAETKTNETAAYVKMSVGLVW